jgi:hypothetical protein
MLGSEGAFVVASYLVESRPLKVLNLSNTRLTGPLWNDTAGVVALGDALKFNVSSIDICSPRKPVQFLSHPPTCCVSQTKRVLSELNLSSNNIGHLISEEGWTFCAPGADFHEYRDPRGQWWEDHFQKPEFEFKATFAIAIANALEHNGTLHTLNLSCNGLGEWEAVNYFADALKVNVSCLFDIYLFMSPFVMFRCCAAV